MHRPKQAPEPLLPPCAGCNRPCGRYDFWGRLLCDDCVSSWLASPEKEAARLELEPMPTWQMARAMAQGQPVPPLATEAQTEAAYRRAITGWLLARKRVAA